MEQWGIISMSKAHEDFSRIYKKAQETEVIKKDDEGNVTSAKEYVINRCSHLLKTAVEELGNDISFKDEEKLLTFMYIITHTIQIVPFTLTQTNISQETQYSIAEYFLQQLLPKKVSEKPTVYAVDFDDKVIFGVPDNWLDLIRTALDENLIDGFPEWGSDMTGSLKKYYHNG